jgi:hypothetical protein
MTHLPYPAGNDGAAHNANPELRQRGSVRGACAQGPSLQKPTTDRLWNEFAVRSLPKRKKTDHRQTVERAWS